LAIVLDDDPQPAIDDSEHFELVAFLQGAYKIGTAHDSSPIVRDRDGLSSRDG
jgi:hypothetical protein